MSEFNNIYKIQTSSISCMLAGIVAFFSLPVISWIPLIAGVVAILLFLTQYKRYQNNIEKTMFNYGLILGIAGVTLFWLTPFILLVLWK